MSVDKYIESHLNDRTKEQILKEIRSLKKQMNELKFRMEHPDYKVKNLVTDEKELALIREYLSVAMKAYAEAGGEYKPTKAELKIQEFENNLDKIKKIVVGCVDEYYLPVKEYEFVFTKDVVKKATTYDVDLIRKNILLDTEHVVFAEKDQFLKELAELHIGEWTGYSADKYNLIFLGGNSWYCNVTFEKGIKKFSAGGENVYPYNFDKLQRLLKIKIR